MCACILWLLQWIITELLKGWNRVEWSGMERHGVQMGGFPRKNRYLTDSVALVTFAAISVDWQWTTMFLKSPLCEILVDADFLELEGLFLLLSVKKMSVNEHVVQEESKIL